MSAEVRRDVGVVCVYDGTNGNAGTHDTYELHYGVPRAPIAPRNAGLWFGVYHRQGGRWYFALSELPAHIAAQFRRTLTGLVSA